MEHLNLGDSIIIKPNYIKRNFIKKYNSDKFTVLCDINNVDLLNGYIGHFSFLRSKILLIEKNYYLTKEARDNYFAINVRHFIKY